ncbi:MAG: hypothetical protein AAGA36_00125 [Pseudomonadota bacterium]
MKLYYWISDDDYGMQVWHYATEQERDDALRLYMACRAYGLVNEEDAAPILKRWSDKDNCDVKEIFDDRCLEDHVTWDEIDIDAVCGGKVELKTQEHLDDGLLPGYAAKVRETALDAWENDDLQVEPNGQISAADEHAWVQAWVLVNFEDLDGMEAADA